MFGLAGLAAPLIGNMLGGIFGGQGNQGSQGCHGNHHHHHNNNSNNNQAAQDFRMARQDFGDAQRNFAQGNVFGGLSELAEARQHVSDGLSHMTGGRGYI